MTKAAGRARIDAVIRLLCDSFPQTFSCRRQHPQPLKVGVYADALAALGAAIQPRDLKSALRAYTSRASYLRALTAGAPRVGIDGESAGAVTPDEEAVAKVRLAELAKRMLSVQFRTTFPYHQVASGLASPLMRMPADQKAVDGSGVTAKPSMVT